MSHHSRDRATAAVGRPGSLRRAALGLAGAAAAASLGAAAQPAGAAVATVERVNVATDGTPGYGYSPLKPGRKTAISDDGRFVAFASQADGLVPEELSASDNVFLRDRLLRTTTLVSRASDGTPGNRLSINVEISRDGRYVMFASDATNLVPGDTNGVTDTFLFDRVTGRTERVSVGDRGQQANYRSAEMIVGRGISDDGRYVAFQSAADNLVPAGETVGLYVRDRVAGTTRPAIALPAGRFVSIFSEVAMSANARAFAFPLRNVETRRDELFWQDAERGETQRVDVLLPGNEHRQLRDYGPRLSADGRLVAFTTEDPLVPEDTNEQDDVYVRDMASGEIERASVADDGSQAPYTEEYPGHDQRLIDIDAAGRWVLFEGRGLTGEGRHSFRRDLTAGRTEEIVFLQSGVPRPIHGESVSGDGNHVSAWGDLIEDEDNRHDVYAFDLVPIRPPEPGDRWADAVQPGGTAQLANAGASLGRPDGRAATLSGSMNRSVTWLMHEPGIGDLTLHLSGGTSLALAPTVELLGVRGRVLATLAVRTFLSSGRRTALVPYAGRTAYSGIRIRTGLYTRVHVDAIEAEELAG